MSFVFFFCGDLHPICVDVAVLLPNYAFFGEANFLAVDLNYPSLSVLLNFVFSANYFYNSFIIILIICGLRWPLWPDYYDYFFFVNYFEALVVNCSFPFREVYFLTVVCFVYVFVFFLSLDVEFILNKKC